MIERNHPALSIGAQCRLLSISRSSFYHEAAGETDQNLGLMRLIDRQFLDTPFYGVRQMTWHLQDEGHGVNQKRIRRLMRLMRLMPIYQKPNTSKPRKGHKTYPYLLAGLRVDRPGQVWCADITFLPMRRGFLYLVAIMDWFTRKVLAWRISNTLEADYGVKWDKAVAKLVRDRDVLLTFYDYPAEHWKHVRTSNPIESTFATVRHRTKRTKGCLSRKTGLAMAFRLMMSAQAKWRKLDGRNRLAQRRRPDPSQGAEACDDHGRR